MQLTSEMRRVVRYATRRSFYAHALYTFGIRYYCDARPDDNWLYPPIHRELAHWLQGHYEEWKEWRRAGIRRVKSLAIIEPRGTGKSTFITEAATTWFLVDDPELVISMSSFDNPTSESFLGVVKTVFEGRAQYGLFNDLYGSYETPDATWSSDRIVISPRATREIRNPSVFTTSIQTGGTSTRPDIALFDDLLPWEKIEQSPDVYIRRARAHMENMRYPLKTNGMEIHVLTPGPDGDIADKILKEEGVRSFADTGMRPDEGDYWEGKRGKWDVFYVSGRRTDGSPAFPNILPEEAMEDKRKTSIVLYTTQILCRKASEGMNQLSRDYVRKLWIPKEEIPKRARHVIHFDTAFKDTEDIAKGCESAIVHECQPIDGSGDVIFLSALHSDKWTQDEFYTTAIDFFLSIRDEYIWPVYAVTDDKEEGGKHGNAREVLYSRCKAAGLRTPRLIEIPRRAPRYKERHILKFIDFVQQGKVRFVMGGAGLDTLVDQLVRFRRCKLNDVADAAKDAFHPEVYVPERPDLFGPELERPRRPMDDYLIDPGGPMAWSDSEIRHYMTESARERAVKLAEFREQEKRGTDPRIERVWDGWGRK